MGATQAAASRLWGKHADRFRSVVVGRASLTASGWDDLLANTAVRRENTVKTNQVDARARNERSEPCDEIQWLENDVSGAVSPGRLERVANLALAGQ